MEEQRNKPSRRGPGDFILIAVVLAFCAVALRHIILSRKDESKTQLTPVLGTGGMDLLWNNVVKPAKDTGADSRPKKDSMIVWDEPRPDYRGSRKPEFEEPEEEEFEEEPPPEREEDPLEDFPPEQPQPKPTLNKMPFSFTSERQGGQSSSAFMPYPKPVQQAAPAQEAPAPTTEGKTAPSKAEHERRPWRSNQRR
ncbi:MAG: hypothetical protein WC728_14950 [Elusimicrobiota bacterium]